MPYLIRIQKDQLLLLTNSTRNGLYFQTLSPSGFSRPTIIHRTASSEYSAAVDGSENLHIVTKPSNEQVIHLHYKDNNLTREVILEDPKGIYNFSNINMLYANERMHLFYTANQPIGNSSELIHHILCEENKIETSPIVSFSNKPLGFCHMNQNNTIYVLYGEIESSYNLKLLIYKENVWSQPIMVTSSSFPIDDFQFCVDQGGIIHVVYLQEKYGRYHILYKKNNNDIWTDEVLLHTTPTKVAPIIFNYHGGLWINFIDNHNLQMILSMDNGGSFSKVVPCSLQGADLQRYQFISSPSNSSKHLCANNVYAALGATIRVGIISLIDMIGLHPDIPPNTELELLIDGITHFSTINARVIAPNIPSDYEAIVNENNELKQTQELMIQQYNEMAELTKKIQEEGKKWRNRAVTLESQLPGAMTPLNKGDE